MACDFVLCVRPSEGGNLRDAPPRAAQTASAATTPCGDPASNKSARAPPLSDDTHVLTQHRASLSRR
eukprot:scaffold129443_cov33-Tisochrysis_lutea.AAC.3